MKKDVIIVSTDLSAKKDDVFKSLDDSIELCDAISEYAEKLKETDVDIWEQKDNILITELGYYLAIFPNVIKEVLSE